MCVYLLMFHTHSNCVCFRYKPVSLQDESEVSVQESTKHPPMVRSESDRQRDRQRDLVQESKRRITERPLKQRETWQKQRNVGSSGEFGNLSLNSFSREPLPSFLLPSSHDL